MKKYPNIAFKDKDVARFSNDKKYKMKTKSGGTAKVSEKAVMDARSKTGAFKSRGTYKGKVMKSGVKLNDGTFIRATNPKQMREAKKKLDYDKRLFELDKKKHSQRTERFSKAKRV